ncbi:DNA repair protein RecO [Hahella ganghwensis]|uniref:DNA repair protein RecO n=1 Tax=Hahella ganghwensis TaxID=286420 RepID=UPI000377E784|nr:DNA repair protein RecO [Hahella ganghwensis]
MQNLQCAFVLHTRPYRESSLIVDLFCEESGRVAAVVKGGRVKKGLSALLQPFQKILVSFSGNSELKNLMQVESGDLHLTLSGLSLYSGFYLNELILKLLPVHGGPSDLFSQYVLALKALAAGEVVEPSLREFELALLYELGVGFDFCYESTTGTEVMETQYYLVDAISGIQRADPADPKSLKGSVMLAIAQRLWQDPAVLLAAKKVCRSMINTLLDGKELQSRKVMRQYVEALRREVKL